MAIVDPYQSATQSNAPVCRENPYIIAGLLKLLGKKIIGVAPGEATGEVVVFQQLQDLETSVLQLLSQQNSTVQSQISSVLNEITNINGMSPADVTALIRTVLSEQYDNAQIDAIIASQGEGLIAALTEAVAQLRSRIEQVESRVQAGADALTVINQAIADHESEISALQAADVAQNTLIQSLMNRQPIVIEIDNGIIISAIGIALADVVRECEGPGYVNLIVKATISRRLKTSAWMYVGGDTLDVHLGSAMLPIMVEDGDYLMGQKLQVTVPSSGRYSLEVY